MVQKIKSFIRENLIIIFIIFILVAIVWGLIFNYKLENPDKNEIKNVINKFSINNYSLPYYIAERYIIWLDMRKIYFWTYFSLSLFSVVASLVTVFFATQNDEERKKKHIIILSLLSICFTIASFIINPGRRAFAIQHAWRELDICIIQTISNKSLSNEEKDNIITNKIVEMERYIEMKED